MSAIEVEKMTLAKVSRLRQIVENAFHGTTWATAKKIEVEGFEIGKSPKGYLGDGVYFYEGSKMLARNHVTKRRRFVKWAILQSTINLGKCLDLNTPEHRMILEAVREVMIEEGGYDPEDLTDALIINWYAVEYETELETIRWNLSDPLWPAIYPRSRIRRSEPIICVKKRNNISDSKIIDKGTRRWTNLKKN